MTCIAATGATLVAAPSSSAKAQLPWERCRAVSKVEYDSAKRDNLLSTRVGTYLRAGTFWRRRYPYCRHSKTAMGQWLIADVSFLEIHLQLWMLLVAGVVLLWFLYVWATR
jgi:hypothetical protein